MATRTAYIPYRNHKKHPYFIPPPHTPDANHYNRKPPAPVNMLITPSPNLSEPSTAPSNFDPSLNSSLASFRIHIQARFQTQLLHTFPLPLLPPRSTSPCPIQPPTHTLKRHILPLTLNMIRTPPIPILLERPPGSRLIRVPRARRSDGSRPRRFARHSLRGRGARRAGYLCHYNQLFALM